MGGGGYTRSWVAYIMRSLGVFLLLAGSRAAPLDLAYLEKNAAAAGVTVLPSGLQYRVLKRGSGERAPTSSEPCECHYEGKLVDGTTFDSSRKRGSPATFKPSGVIAGWTEALQLMKEGDRWELTIPASLAYGDRGAGGRIPGGATLIFDLELLRIKEAGAGFYSSLGMPDALDESIFGPVSLGHAIVVMLLWSLYSWMGGAGAGGKKASASHILVADRELCVKIKEEIAALLADPNAIARDTEEVFGRLAAKHSTCPSAKSGGALGTFSQGQMVPAFDAVCWSAPLGEVQGPVETQFGFHLILVTKRTEPADATKAAKAK